MENSGVCVACGASEVERNEEMKCTNCAGAATTPAETSETAPVEAPTEVPAESGDTPSAE